MPQSADLDRYYEKVEELWEKNRLEDAAKAAAGAVEALPYEPEPHLWLGDLNYEMDEWARALEHYEKALELDEMLIEAMTSIAKIRFERLEFSAAAELAEKALSIDPEWAEGNYYKALLLEREGNFSRADKYLRKASNTDPELYPSPFKVSRDRFDEIVEKALEVLTPKVRNFLKNTAVIVEQVPDIEDLRGGDPPLSPHILGLFRGTSAPERSIESAWSQMPSQIVLYQRNLEHFCQEEPELVEQIRITVLHEIGHYLGLDESDLEDRGLD
ncbi:MAG: metallopeptidase family protein [Deltaproteobacteria bacterium]|nr:metallopeptidase family protein [Deltaproteobacteria bacterium]